MADFPQPKYKKGDKVFFADRVYSSKCISCPDCLGTLKWIVTFADGESIEIDCQTCRDGFSGPKGTVCYNNWKPKISVLTIGSIKFDDEKFKYMCDETGVGSGQVYNEFDLHLDKNKADKQAKEKHKEGMKQLARNNFSKKFNGSKEIENMLSTFGFSRQQILVKKRKFIEWAEISDLVKKKGGK